MAVGGSITRDSALSHIVSIGYELEAVDISPITITGSQIKFNRKPQQYGELLRTIDTDFHDDYRHRLSRLERNLKSRMGDGMVSLPDGQTLYFDKADFTSDSDYQRISHTEFVVTYLDIDTSQDIILTLLDETVNAVAKVLLSGVTITAVQLSGGLMEKGTYYFLLTYPHTSDGYLVVHDSPQLSIVDDILWEPQVTVGVNIQDVIVVTQYLGQHTSYDTDYIYDMTLNMETHMRSELGIDSFNPTEACLAYLFNMFIYSIVNQLKKSPIDSVDYRLAIRHNFNEILDYHRDDVGAEFYRALDLDHEMPDVTLFKYNGAVLFELRNMYAQFVESFYPGWTSPVGLPISKLLAH